MKPTTLLIALVFAGVTAVLLGQCVNSWAGDAGRQGEPTGGITDGRSVGGYCGCLTQGAPGYGSDPGGLATDHDVQAQGDPNGTCGCTP